MQKHNRYRKGDQRQEQAQHHHQTISFNQAHRHNTDRCDRSQVPERDGEGNGDRQSKDW